jgi:N-acyl-D-amino-acid deacylase
VEAGTPVEPTSLVRIGSCSKPLTAVAILQLADRKRISLDDKAVALLGIEPLLEPGKQADPRINQITIRHLLNHTGGWERDVPYDPMYGSGEMYRALGTEPPAMPADIFRYWLARPLKWEPGTTYSYYNLGYSMLGRIIEKASGMTYEEYVKSEVLAPLGIKQMRIGGSFLSDRTPGEVKYYEASGEPTPVLFGPDKGKLVPRCYGGRSMAAIDSCGGWIASAADLARFAAAFDFPQRCKILKPATVEQMFTPSPVFKVAAGEETYGMGWFIRTYEQNRRTIYHGGLLKESAAAMILRRSDGVNITVVMNTSPDTSGERIETRISQALYKFKPNDWPNHDLFPTLGQNGAQSSP